MDTRSRARLNPRSTGRQRAERARREIEAGKAKLDWKLCEAEGAAGTKLPGCAKLYVPLGADSPSAAPFGFVFRLTQESDGSLSWWMLAFGERHPAKRQTRSVYARAHKRMHSHYP